MRSNDVTAKFNDLTAIFNDLTAIFNDLAAIFNDLTAIFNDFTAHHLFICYALHRCEIFYHLVMGHRHRFVRRGSTM